MSKTQIFDFLDLYDSFLNAYITSLNIFLRVTSLPVFSYRVNLVIDPPLSGQLLPQGFVKLEFTTTALTWIGSCSVSPCTRTSLGHGDSSTAHQPRRLPGDPSMPPLTDDVVSASPPTPAPAHREPGPCLTLRRHHLPRKCPTRRNDCRGPHAPRLHTLSPTSGQHDQVQIMANRPLPPSFQGEHTVKSGACKSRTARVGYWWHVWHVCLHAYCFL